MSNIYIHVWECNGEPLMQEQAPVTGEVQDAIDEYYEQAGMFPYMHTIVLCSSAKNWCIVDIEQAIANIRDNKREEEYLQQIEDSRYRAYDDQIQSYYYSTRI